MTSLLRSDNEGDVIIKARQMGGKSSLELDDVIIQIGRRG